MAESKPKSLTYIVVGVPLAVALSAEPVAWAWHGPDYCPSQCYEQPAAPPQGAHGIEGTSSGTPWSQR